MLTPPPRVPALSQYGGAIAFGTTGRLRDSVMADNVAANVRVLPHIFERNPGCQRVHRVPLSALTRVAARARSRAGVYTSVRAAPSPVSRSAIQEQPSCAAPPAVPSLLLTCMSHGRDYPSLSPRGGVLLLLLLSWLQHLN